MKELQQKIEAILFYSGEPVSLDFLEKTLSVSKKEIENVVGELKESLKNRGIRLVEHNNVVSLVTAPEFSDVIEKIIKEERERDFGRAGIETLAIVAYKGPVNRKEIEYIRGVNCQFVLRNLLLRGLVERNDRLYSITSDAVRFLGLSNIAELPEYQKIRRELEVKEEGQDE